MQLRVFAATAVLALSATGALGCGSDDDGDGGGGGGGESARGVTDTTVKVGALNSLSGAAPWTGINVGAEARFARANREGGVAGREIDYDGSGDDASDPAQNLSVARRLVLRDEVFAIVPATSVALEPPTTNFLEAEKVPFIGWGFKPGYCGTDFAFGFNGCIVGTEQVNLGLTKSTVDGLSLEEGSTVAVQSWDTSEGKSGGQQMKLGMEHFGMEVPYLKNNLPATPVTDFTPYVQDLLRSAGGQAPDVIIINTGVLDTAVGLTAALKAAGYDGAILHYSNYLPDLLKSDKGFRSAVDGSYVAPMWLPAEVGGPAIEAIEEDLEAIGEEPIASANVSMGYWSADLLLQMLEAVGEDLTPERFDEVINGEGFTYEPPFDPPGIGPVEYPRNHTVPVQCTSLVRAVGDVYKPIEPFACADEVVEFE